MTKTELAVGDSTELEIIFNTGNYAQHQAKSPVISTNEGPQTKSVHISVDIINNPDSTDPIIIKPYKFDISQFGEKERNTLEFTIRNISNTDLELKLVDMPAKMFKLTLPKKIRAGGTEKGKIIVQKGFVSQEFEKSLTIELNDKLLTRFTVPVKRIIRIPGTADTTKTKK